MPISVTITNNEAPGSNALVDVTVVTAGNFEAADQRHRVPAQQAVTVQVHLGQFVMVDEAEIEEFSL